MKGIIFFDIKKCGEVSFTMCKPPRLPVEKFVLFNHLPDPVMASDGHYKRFNDVFETNTIEEQRPSLEEMTTILSKCKACQQCKNNVDV